MKKRLLIVFILFYSFICISNANDSLFISSKKYQSLDKKIVLYEKNRAELTKEIERVDGRISDWYTNFAIGGSLFIVLLAGLFAVQWSNTKGIAKEQAEKELEDYQKEIEAKIIEINALSQDAHNRVKSIKDAEILIKKSIKP